MVKLWTINRALRWIGLTVTVHHPSAAHVPTLFEFRWIGWASKRSRAAEDARGAASGYERDALGEARYQRCVQAMATAWDDAVSREYS